MMFLGLLLGWLGEISWLVVTLQALYIGAVAFGYDYIKTYYHRHHKILDRLTGVAGIFSLIYFVLHWIPMEY
jgi:ABC-type uncharacterized transport system permease subunit